MNQLNVWMQGSIFYALIRKRIIKKVVSNYYRNYHKLISGKTVLEIGCGNGQGAALVKKYFSPKQIIAIDLDERLVKLAKTNIKDSSIHFEVADATKLRFKDNSFDAIFDFGVIHHIPDWENCLKELHRVLGSKGIIFIYDIPIESFTGLWGRFIKRFTLHPYEDMYRKNEFLQYLSKLNFKILMDEPYKNPLRYFVLVAQKK